MDNAAKALMIAGGMLVGVLIISISMYLLTSFRDAYSNSMASIQAERANEFNYNLVRYGSPNEVVPISGPQAWNILAYVKEVNSDEDSFGTYIESGGLLTVDNYMKVLYFSDVLINRTFYYSYELNSSGMVSRVTIN